MTTKKTELTESKKLLQDLKSFATTLVEECPPQHRRDPASGACLPMGSIDHTAETRSVNDDQGDLWRGLRDKVMSSENKEAALMNADEMDEPVSCAEGTTFSFISRTCVSLEQAEQENSDQSAMSSDTDYVEVEVATHQDVVALDPEGRKDPVGFKCPPSQFFDFSRRECIPLNKDTVMASESVDEEFKKLFATYLSGRLGMTTPDPLDGHTHLVTVDENGDGKSSVTNTYGGSENYPHSHDVSEYVVKDHTSGDYTSRHFGFVIPKDMWEWKNEEEREHVMSQPSVCRSEEAAVETAAPITTKQRKSLPDSTFGVPGKRKFPLDTCARVRNAMARFNQAKGLTAGEKSSLRRKIMAAASKCGIKVTNFAKANTVEEFAGVLNELLLSEGIVNKAVAKKDMMDDEMPMKKKKGPCPPWMEWDAKTKKCGKTKGFYEAIKTQGSHSEIIALDPEGRKDTPGFQCPPGSFFDFAKRECVALDPSKKTGTTTSKASTEDAAQKDLTPSPAGRPARLPSDCPPNTIWNADREDCVPLDSSKKTKGETEAAGDEGLVPAPAGKVKLPSDCPPNTLWDGVNKLCRPLDSSDKSRPSGASPQSPKSTATADTMSVAQLIRQLDEIINVEKASGSREKFKIDAKELPNEAFPPSLVSSTRRALLHHTPGVKDSYDNASIDTARLRNALARVTKLEGYSAPALEDATKHLIDHAREVVKVHLGKS